MVLKNKLHHLIERIKNWLARLSFRTGVVVLLFAIPFYIFSFAQMLLPISPAWKSGFFIFFFGLAKTAQYAGLLILGAEGIRRLKKRLSRKGEEHKKTT